MLYVCWLLSFPSVANAHDDLSSPSKIWSQCDADGEKALEDGNYDAAERSFRQAMEQCKHFYSADYRPFITLESLAAIRLVKGDALAAQNMHLTALSTDAANPLTNAAQTSLTQMLGDQGEVMPPKDVTPRLFQYDAKLLLPSESKDRSSGKLTFRELASDLEQLGHTNDRQLAQCMIKRAQTVTEIGNGIEKHDASH
jgi:hypothetical protein